MKSIPYQSGYTPEQFEHVVRQLATHVLYEPKESYTTSIAWLQLIQYLENTYRSKGVVVDHVNNVCHVIPSRQQTLPQGAHEVYYPRWYTVDELDMLLEYSCSPPSKEVLQKIVALAVEIIERVRSESDYRESHLLQVVPIWYHTLDEAMATRVLREVRDISMINYKAKATTFDILPIATLMHAWSTTYHQQSKKVMSNIVSDFYQELIYSSDIVSLVLPRQYTNQQEHSALYNEIKACALFKRCSTQLV
jgi:hypothetical protein